MNVAGQIATYDLNEIDKNSLFWLAIPCSDISDTDLAQVITQTRERRPRMEMTHAPSETPWARTRPPARTYRQG